MIIYQVLTRLWKEGKFSSWDKTSFDYLKKLGVDCIWFTGIPRHASGLPFVKGDPGCPYSLEDPTDINYYLADNKSNRLSEFKALMKRTHDAGFKAVVDFIPNHMACSYKGHIPLCVHCDYDWTDTLKIDYSRREAWDGMIDVVRTWANRGVDGMRCDMVELVPKDFFRELIATIKSEFPGFFFIAEVYGRENYWEYVKNVGFDLLYDKSGLYDRLNEISNGYGNAQSITFNWQGLGELQFNMLNFLENHDEMRNSIRGYAPLAVSALFNDASFMIYFGQEIGERALESDNRRTSIFNWTKTFNPGAKLTEEQKNTLERFRTLARQRKLVEGSANWDLCYCSPIDRNTQFAFLRITSKKVYLFACNFSENKVSMKVHIPKETGLSPGFLDIDIDPLDYQLRIFLKS